MTTRTVAGIAINLGERLGTEEDGRPASYLHLELRFVACEISPAQTAQVDPGTFAAWARC